MKLIYAVAVVLLFLSCGPKTIYKKYEKAPDYVWQAKDVKSFTFSVETPNQNIDAYIILRHITNCPYAAISVLVQSESLGNEFNKTVIIPIRSEDGKLLGDGSGDYWDIELSLGENFILPAGTHTVSLRALDTYQLIDDIGIKLTDAKALDK